MMNKLQLRVKLHVGNVFLEYSIQIENTFNYMLVNMCVDGDYDVPSPDLKSFLICIDSHHSFFSVS